MRQSRRRHRRASSRRVRQMSVRRTVEAMPGLAVAMPVWKRGMRSFLLSTNTPPRGDDGWLKRKRLRKPDAAPAVGDGHGAGEAGQDPLEQIVVVQWTGDDGRIVLLGHPRCCICRMLLGHQRWRRWSTAWGRRRRRRVQRRTEGEIPKSQPPLHANGETPKSLRPPPARHAWETVRAGTGAWLPLPDAASAGWGRSCDAAAGWRECWPTPRGRGVGTSAPARGGRCGRGGPTRRPDGRTATRGC